MEPLAPGPDSKCTHGPENVQHRIINSNEQVTKSNEVCTVVGLRRTNVYIHFLRRIGDFVIAAVCAGIAGQAAQRYLFSHDTTSEQTSNFLTR